MARPIFMSNGELSVGLNKFGLVHDFYFPYVGLENHSAGDSMRHRVGVWVDGQLSWLDDGSWNINFTYPDHSLVGNTLAKNDNLGVVLEFDDFVDSDISAFVRNIHVVNTRDYVREIRLFTHQAFSIGDSRSKTDTAQFLPDSNSILHYRGDRAFVISGWVDSENRSFDQHTIGIFGMEGREGSYRDADDGELTCGLVEHGRVDSMLRFALRIEAHASSRVHYWIAAGKSIREALYVDKFVKKTGADKMQQTTAAWWHKWLEPAMRTAEKLPEKYRHSLVHSCMVIKSQIDKRGAVIASLDSTMLNYARDAYSYSWPRDGGYVLWPLIRMGYKEEAFRFFDFCRRGLHADGYLLHKYRADGAPGASWHPYVRDGISTPPIQEDETALVLFVFAQFYNIHQDKKILDDYYESLIVPMADFMAGYIDSTTGLPKPTYDLWEEVLKTTTYTVSVTYAALLAAAELASVSQDDERAVRWRTAADDIRTAAHKHLFNPERNYFYKGLTAKNGEIIKDDTMDLSAFFGAFIYGLFPVNSPELVAAHQAILDRFGDTALPRYEGDYYHRISDDSPPNPWFITTLWRAQYLTEIGQLDEAHRLIDWAIDHSSETGLMSEQLDPYTGERKSVEPLTWSHAELVSSLLDTISGTD